MEEQSSNEAQRERLFGFLNQHLAGLSEKTLEDLILIMSDQDIYSKINGDHINLIDDYKPIELAGKRWFTTGAGKPPAGVLRIASMLGSDGREQVLEKLVDAKDSVEFAKKLAAEAGL